MSFQFLNLRLLLKFFEEVVLFVRHRGAWMVLSSKESKILFNLNSFLLRYDTIGRIELIPSIVLSSDNTNYKNIIQLFLQLFDELSVYRDCH